MVGLLFGGGPSEPPPLQKVDPDEETRELRRRLAVRGGEQSTILTGLLAKKSAAPRSNVFRRTT